MARRPTKTTVTEDQVNNKSTNLNTVVDTVDSDHLGQQMIDFMARLFPINRSITGEGIRETFEILRERIPLNIHHVPTGYEAFDWTVPQEWNVRDAWVKHDRGERVIDFQQSNVHLLGYSMPVSANLTLNELRSHLHTLPEQADAIPYLTSYYEERWGFCLSHKQLEKMADGPYEVVVDTELKDGYLTFADLVLPGKSNREILFSTYLCHPSLANDNLSGPVLLSFLYHLLSRCELRYTYRFVFVPETIGALVYLSQFGKHLQQSLDAGYVATCVGDPGPFTYKRSRRGNTMADKVAEHCLEYITPDIPKIFTDFFPSGSDERQYCSPGFDLPVGSLMRSMYGAYPEYHTSLDNMDLVSSDALADTLKAYLRLVQVHELNQRYTNLSPWGEPQLSKRSLYPTLGAVGPALVSEERTRIMYLLAYSDGTKDIVDIANLAKQPAWEFASGIEALTDAELLALKS